MGGIFLSSKTPVLQSQVERKLSLLVCFTKETVNQLLNDLEAILSQGTVLIILNKVILGAMQLIHADAGIAPKWHITP